VALIYPLRVNVDRPHRSLPAAAGTYHRSILPKVLKPIRRQRRVDGRADDRPMAEPACPGVAAVSEPPIVMTPVRHDLELLKFQPSVFPSSSAAARR
jgi:hypothetical protein